MDREKHLHWLLIIIFGIMNLVIGILNTFFLQEMTFYETLSINQIVFSKILGIACLIIGVVSIFLIIKPILSKIPPFFEMIYSKIETIYKSQTPIEKLLNEKPTTAEDSLEILKKLQYYADIALKNSKYEETIRIISAKDEVYKKTIDLAKNIGLSTLIPSLTQERKKNQKTIYDIKHNFWATQFNDILEKLKSAEDHEDYSATDINLKNLIQMVDDRVEIARSFENKPDVAEYQEIRCEYEELIQVNDSILMYKESEICFNKIVELVKRNRLSDAVSMITDLEKRLIHLDSLIKTNLLHYPKLSNIYNALNSLSDKLTSLKAKIEDHFSSLLVSSKQSELRNINKISTKINLPELQKISMISLKTPLYAKVVILGESSVGKTHLVLTMTGKEYHIKQGSTIGVDKYFLPVKIPFEEFDSQLCFWDLGGQWNFRAINELFLNEAIAVLLVYDMTRPETYAALEYWISVIEKTRCNLGNRLFIVGNKLDVGGNAIDEEKLIELKKNYGIDYIYNCSAKSGEGVTKLLEDLTGSIDWSELIKNLKEKNISAIGGELNSISKKIKIIKTSDLLNKLSKLSGISDLLVLKAILRQYASQNLVLFGRDDVYTITDPENISKIQAKLIKIASTKNGIVEFDNAKKLLPREQLEHLFNYLELENVCYQLGPLSWVFPNVLHKSEPELSEKILAILESKPYHQDYTFHGPGDLIFNRLSVSTAREIGNPEFISNEFALWKTGKGRYQSVILMQLIPNEKNNLIRIKTGGGRGKMVMEQVQSICLSILKLYSKNYQLT